MRNAVSGKGPRKTPKLTFRRQEYYKKHKKKFDISRTPEDLRDTQAVRTALLKEQQKCLRPVGYKQLMATLAKSDKARKPITLGDKCIAVPQGYPKQKQGLAAWLPCKFIAEIFPNEKVFHFYLLERTESQQATDKRLCEVFAVRSTDCFLVPPSYGPDYDLHFQPRHGVYVLEDKVGNKYVGESKNIERRVHYHNAGKGATFTNGKKWWRVCPIAPIASQGQSQESAEYHAQVAVHGEKKVRGAHRCQREACHRCQSTF